MGDPFIREQPLYETIEDSKLNSGAEMNAQLSFTAVLKNILNCHKSQKTKHQTPRVLPSSVCMYVCRYVCMCVHEYTHTYTHIHTYRWSHRVWSLHLNSL